MLASMRCRHVRRSLAAFAQRRGLRLAAINLSVTGDPLDNLKRAAQGISVAAAEGATIAALPECFVGSYGVAHFEKWAEVLGGGFGGSAMMAEAARNENIYVCGGIIEADEEAKRMFNTMVVYGPDGELAAKYRKVHLSRVMGITSESDVLAPGNRPISFLCNDAAGDSYRVGLVCCFDLRFPRLLSAYGLDAPPTERADVLLAPSAFLDATGRDHWELLCRRAALDTQTFVVAPNVAFRCDDAVPLHGRSMIVGPWGDILGESEVEGDGVVVAEASRARLEEVRGKLPLATAQAYP